MRQDKLDLIIEGGWVIDGLGGPRVRADVAWRMAASRRWATCPAISPTGGWTRPDASWRPASSTCTVTTT